METHTHCNSDGRTNKDERISLMQEHTFSLARAHPHLLIHTCTTQYTPLRQRTLDYSANGCTTDHRAALLQTGLLCSLSVGWKCCMGLGLCGFGALKGRVCACYYESVCTRIKAEKCSHAALPNERAGHPLNGR